MLTTFCAQFPSEKGVRDDKRAIPRHQIGRSVTHASILALMIEKQYKHWCELSVSPISSALDRIVLIGRLLPSSCGTRSHWSRSWAAPLFGRKALESGGMRSTLSRSGDTSRGRPTAASDGFPSLRCELRVEKCLCPYFPFLPICLCITVCVLYDHHDMCDMHEPVVHHAEGLSAHPPLGVLLFVPWSLRARM